MKRSLHNFEFMIFTNKQSQNIYFEIRGNLQSQKCIVFLNGLSQSTLAWSFMIPNFEKDYKILLMDFIFQGQSDKEGTYKNFDEHAEDVISLMQHLQLPKAIICGISYGSLVAQNLATNYPLAVEKLVLISTFAHKSEYFKAIELSWQRAVELGGYNMLLDVMLPYVLGENYFENPIIPISILKTSRQEINESSEALLKLMRATAERKDYRAELHKIKSSTLIIHGVLDKLIPVELARAVHQNIEGSQFRLLQNVGHTLNLEAALDTSKLIIDFIK